jgi:hypothetical protein
LRTKQNGAHSRGKQKEHFYHDDVFKVPKIEFVRLMKHQFLYKWQMHCINKYFWYHAGKR